MPSWGYLSPWDPVLISMLVSRSQRSPIIPSCDISYIVYQEAVLRQLISECIVSGTLSFPEGFVRNRVQFSRATQRYDEGVGTYCFGSTSMNSLYWYLKIICERSVIRNSLEMWKLISSTLAGDSIPMLFCLYLALRRIYCSPTISIYLTLPHLQ